MAGVILSGISAGPECFLSGEYMAIRSSTVTRSQLFNTRGANTTNILKDAANESINDKNVFPLFRPVYRKR